MAKKCLNKQFFTDLDELRGLMNSGRWYEADVLCQKLLPVAEAQGGPPEVIEELAEMQAAIIIETDQRGRIPAAMKLVEKYCDSAYGKFLIARMFFQEKRRLRALLALEEAFSPSWENERLVIPQGNLYWQALPDQQGAILNLFSQLYKFFGLPSQSSQCYLLASQVAKRESIRLSNYSNYLFNMHYLFVRREDYFRAHVAYNEFFADVVQFGYDRKALAERYKKRGKLRIGYISPDLRHHVVLLFIWAMLTQYSAEEFEVYLFSNSLVEDVYSNYLKAHVQFWCNISHLTPQQAAVIVHGQELDILVELAGHSANNCLPVLAYKPAPVQICGIGYFATTGLRAVDYFLTDRHLTAGGSEKFFTEKLLVLPHSHFCYVPLKETPPVQGAPCKKNGYITFGSFNNTTKVNDEVLRVWAEILRQVPQARLFLKCSHLGDADLKELLVGRLQEAGIALDRCILRGFSVDYLQEYYEMDIALDTFPYPGGGTTCDALYMGVPVITLGDGSVGGNFGVSLLQNVGLEFACAASVEEYVMKAVALAQDFELLDVLHLGLRKMMENSPVMDTELYMQDLEGAYKQIWEDYIK